MTLTKIINLAFAKLAPHNISEKRHPAKLAAAATAMKMWLEELGVDDPTDDELREFWDIVKHSV